MIFPLIFPLELTDLICEKIYKNKLVEICIFTFAEKYTEFSVKNCTEFLMKTHTENLLYILNEDRIKKYWEEMGIYELIKFNDIPGVKYLKTDTFISNNDNLAISIACKFASLEMIKYLVSLGADISTQFETIACRYTFQREYLEIIKYYISLGHKVETNFNILYSICRDKDLETVKYLVEIGAIIPYCNDAIIRASGENLELVKYFISLGADPRASKDTPLITACDYNKLSIMKYLISLGANPRTKNNTILKRISAYGNMEMLRYILPLLLEKGGKDIDFDKYITLAKENYYFRAMKYLENEKAKYLKVNKTD